MGFIGPRTYKNLDLSQAIAICIMSVIEKADPLRAEARLQIKFCSEGLVQAAVRGDHGVYDVRWTSMTGFECSCPADRIPVN